MAQQPPPADQQLPPAAEQPMPPAAEQDLPPPPVQKPRKRPPPTPSRYQQLKLAGPRFAPVQRCLQDIPVAQFDICNNGNLHERYLACHWTMGKRDVSIGPGTYYGVPITCHPNPVNTHIPVVCTSDKEPETFTVCGHSHHIVEVFDSGAEDVLKAQLLIQDFSNYQTAFRVKHGAKEWSKFFHTNDQMLPEFLEGERLGISGAHKDMIEIGGYCSLREMLLGFGAYVELSGVEAIDKGTDKKKEIKNKIKESIRGPFMIGVHFFPEAKRDRFLMWELYLRMELGAAASPLCYRIRVPQPAARRGYVKKRLSARQVWDRYHNHSNFSCLVLKTGHEKFGNGELIKGIPENYDSLYGISSFDQIIGPFGLMQRIMWKADPLGLDMSIDGVLGARAEARGIIDPRFKDKAGNLIEYVENTHVAVYPEG